MEHEHNEYRKNPKRDFMLSAKRIKLNWMFNEDMGGKYETVTGHMA